MIALVVGLIAIVLIMGAVMRHLNDECNSWEKVANDLEYQLHEERLRVSNLKAKLAERPLPAQPEEEPETGNFVRTRKIKRATPETYRNVFDMDLNGQRVLEHLTMVFCKEAFVSNDKGGERETCHRLGQQSVINFIVNSINQANNPSYKEEVND